MWKVPSHDPSRDSPAAHLLRESMPASGAADEWSEDKIQVSGCFFRYINRGELAAKVWLPRRFLALILDFTACCCIVFDLMWVPETACVLVSAILSVFIFDRYVPQIGSNLTWTTVSFLVAFPLQNAIRSAYQRREAALKALVNFRGLLVNIFLAHAHWDWPGADGYCGRGEDNKSKEDGGKGIKKKPCNVALSPSHGQNVKILCLDLVDALQDFLLVPRSGHPREGFMSCGKDEKAKIYQAESAGRRHMVMLLAKLHGPVEDLKAAGMPANEASRINQYNCKLSCEFEELWAAKVYRTPVALRSFLRVIVQFLPFTYGPYWVHLARADDEKLTMAGIVFACFFSSFISILLIAMINLEDQIENPFKFDNRDTVRVKEEIELCREILDDAELTLATAWHQRLDRDWEVLDVMSPSPSRTAKTPRPTLTRDDMLRLQA